MAKLRCPRCQTVIEVQPGLAPVCPTCGFAGPTPGATPAPPPTSAPTPVRLTLAPETVPSSLPAPRDAPPLGGAADAATLRAAGIVDTAAPLAPLPPPAAGKVVQPGLVVLFSIITLGIYNLFWWWRVSRESDTFGGPRRAHGLVKTGILVGLIAGVVAILVAAVILVLVVHAVNAADNDAYTSTDQFIQDLLSAGLAYLLVLVVAILAVLVAVILLLVGEYRTWANIRAREQAAGRADTVNPALYLWLPIGLSVLGGIPVVGVAFRVASIVLQLVFLYKTQSHLNDIWNGAAHGGTLARQA